MKLKFLSNIKQIILLLIILIFVLLAFWNNEVSAKTWNVDDDGGADFEEIQKAVDSAESGDNIKVSEGTYTENLIVDKSINLIGDGEKNTIIDGGKNSNVVKINADSVNISGFKIINGGKGFRDSGIKVESSNNIIYENNCSFQTNGIYLDNSHNNFISKNICSSNSKYGIKLYYTNNTIVTNNICTNNKDSIYFENSSKNTIKNSMSSYNEIGLYLAYASNNNIIKNNTFSYNDDYGIILNFISNNNEISKNTISNNRRGIIVQSFSRNNTAEYNNIFENIKSGIYALCNNNYSIKAINNWWGDSSGPYHHTNPNGKGDEVTEYVEFTPWLSESTSQIDENGGTSSDEKFIEIIFSPHGMLCIIAIIVVISAVGRVKRGKKKKLQLQTSQQQYTQQNPYLQSPQSLISSQPIPPLQQIQPQKVQQFPSQQPIQQPQTQQRFQPQQRPQVAQQQPIQQPHMQKQYAKNQTFQPTTFQHHQMKPQQYHQNPSQNNKRSQVPMVNCPYCKAQVLAKFKFCNMCGKQIKT